jgi:hypothetical protein
MPWVGRPAALELTLESRILIGGLEATPEAAEKLCIFGEKTELHTSGAKAPADFIGSMPGINPRHTARPCFSAASTEGEFE